MAKGFKIEKTLFGTEVFYTEYNETHKICNFVFLEDQKQLEIQTPFFENKNQKEPILLEIELHKDRTTEMIYHNINIEENSFLFKNFSNFKPLKVGKTPLKVREFFIGNEKKSYEEVFSQCKCGNFNIYFFARKTTEKEKDIIGKDIEGSSLDVFLIGAYLFDPSADEEGIFPPLQLLYCTKLYFEDLKMSDLLH